MLQNEDELYYSTNAEWRRFIRRRVWKWLLLSFLGMLVMLLSIPAPFMVVMVTGSDTLNVFWIPAVFGAGGALLLVAVWAYTRKYMSSEQEFHQMYPYFRAMKKSRE